MKVLVVGSGGREHALAWKLAAEAGVGEVLCAPGNPGTARIARNLPIDAADVQALADAAGRHAVDLTVVGPELPLDRGIVDVFAARRLRILGPTRAAAQLECSKVFAKDFMARHGVPTARYRVCDDPGDARTVIASGELGFPVVVKADGLASGKGVVVAPDRAEADRAIAASMEDRRFGSAGGRVVLEECLTGPELSFFALCDGETAIPLASAQDHKRIFDGDQGPNTGGMGAFAPSPLADADSPGAPAGGAETEPPLHDRIMRDIVRPVIRGMRAEGYPYRGFLYAGLMLTCAGPKVIEFNVRFGDPEAQVVIPLLDTPLAPLLVAAADGRLAAGRVPLRREKHVGVVLASRSYPSPGPVHVPISGVDTAAALPDVLVFHAGTAADPGGGVVTAGGRVLTVVGRGATFEQAIARAYEGVSRIRFDGMQFRRDIGQKALPNAAVGENAGKASGMGSG